MPEYSRVAIVGVGLIGGSIGLALRQRGLAAEVIGIGRRESSLQRATERGAVDSVTTNLVRGVADSQMVVVATPVESIADVALAALQAAPKAIVTDAGSVKAPICRQLREAFVDARPAAGDLRQFIGSHPLAGGHRTGPEHAREDLLCGRVAVVTPEDDHLPAVAQRLDEFWQSLGAEVVRLSPEEHDRALAATSHLPHVVAAALSGCTPEEWLQLAASGWADTTRIAAADPGLWLQIFRQNRAAVLDALTRFEHQLTALHQALRTGDDQQLSSILNEAKRMRDALGD
ncbi:MAG: prephenate dehydrogenase/arogenate dehydrogenase family protein [Planctomycetota bacterium]